MPADGEDESDRERLRRAMAESQRLLQISEELLQRLYAEMAALGMRPKDYDRAQRARHRLRVRRYQDAP